MVDTEVYILVHSWNMLNSCTINRLLLNQPSFYLTTFIVSFVKRTNRVRTHKHSTNTVQTQYEHSTNTVWTQYEHSNCKWLMFETRPMYTCIRFSFCIFFLLYNVDRMCCMYCMYQIGCHIVIVIICYFKRMQFSVQYSRIHL